MSYYYLIKKKKKRTNKLAVGDSISSCRRSIGTCKRLAWVESPATSSFTLIGSPKPI